MNDRAEHLFALIGQVDDGLIDAAARPLPVPRPQRRWPKRAALLAACLVLAVGLWRAVPGWLSWSCGNDAAPPPAGDPGDGAPGIGGDQGSTGEAPGEALPSEGSDGDAAPPMEEPGSSQPSELVDGLPVLTLTGLRTEGGGSASLYLTRLEQMDAYLSGAISLPEGTRVLPVYRGAASASDEDAMAALLDEVLARLGLTRADCEILQTSTEGRDGSGPENVSLVSLEAAAADGTRVIVHCDLTYQIYLPSEQLPQGFPRSADTTTPEGARAQGQAILRLLGELLDLEDPVCQVTGGGVDVDGQPARLSIALHEGDDPLAWPGLPTVSTWGLDEGDPGLWLNFDPKLTQELAGDYPILTMDQAWTQLLSGAWTTGDAPRAEDVLRAELVYASDRSGVTLPVYCFYVDQGTVSAGGTVLYEVVCCYVPAVEGRFLDLTSCAAPGDNT